MFPFDAEVLASTYALYNRAIWPAQPVALALAAAALGLSLRPRHGSARAVGVILVAGWLWCGWVFHLQHFAALDFLAPVYGWVFLAEAALLLWSSVWRVTPLRFTGDVIAWAGLAIAVLALLGLPAISLATEAGWQGARIVGVAPGPTAGFTLGLLLLAEGRPRWHLLAIPLLWCARAGVIGWNLAVAEALALAALGLAVLVLAVWKHLRAA